jgi:ParB-like chromosome segregation protein Spo0J
MQVKKVKISDVKTNPKNPRLIKDDKFKKLVKSIQEFPQMLELRPIVVDENNIVLGGNMRLKACLEVGLKEVFIVKADDLTEQQKDEFIVKDNVGFGEWDWDILANEWDTDKLEDWGLDLPVFMDEPSYEDLIGEEKNKPASMKITFKTVEQLQEAENDIQELIDRKYKGAFYSVSAGEI